MRLSPSPEKFHIVIIGAGPAGISAAARAAERDRAAGLAHPSYVLLEGFAAPSKTIQRYQKGKHVMAEPGFLDLRSDVQFAAGTREKICPAGWRILSASITHSMGADVKKVNGARGEFQVQLAMVGIVAETSVGIGLKASTLNRRTRRYLPAVQYQLDDPKEFSDETIIVAAQAIRRSKTRWLAEQTMCGS